MAISIKQIADIIGDYRIDRQIALTPYSFTDIEVLLGAPLTPIVGLDYVSARFIAPRVMRFQSLGGTAAFVPNNNMSGVIEFGILGGSLSQAYIELMQATGIPYPIHIVDLGSGGTAQVIGTACQLVQTPEWTRAAVPGLTVYTFETERLFVMQGIQLPYVVI